MTLTAERQRLRQLLRQRRRALPARQQRHAALRMAWQLWRWPPLRRARHIAGYMASDGELGTLALLHLAQRHGRHCYLPVLRRFPGQQLGFAPLLPPSRLHRHRWGLRQPRTGRLRFARQLDVILLPLTGFDRQGNRLGMGGGFYDRSLARCTAQRPLRIGVAHHCQEVAQVPVQAWDRPLQAVATPAGVIDCRGPTLRRR